MTPWRGSSSTHHSPSVRCLGPCGHILTCSTRKPRILARHRRPLQFRTYHRVLHNPTCYLEMWTCVRYKFVQCHCVLLWKIPQGVLLSVCLHLVTSGSHRYDISAILACSASFVLIFGDNVIFFVKKRDTCGDKRNIAFCIHFRHFEIQFRHVLL